MDSYLEIARKVLHSARQPLSARQILKSAYQLQIVPRDLYGRTQHKTLQARLSSDILELRFKSEFCRTGPGRFFLRELLANYAAPTGSQREYIAPLRAAQLGRFDVLAFPRTDIASLVLRDAARFSVAALMTVPRHYTRMEAVRRKGQLLPFRFLIVLVNDGRVALNQKSSAADGDLRKEGVLGVEGVVRRDDHSLFSVDEIGLSDAAVRTLIQYLGLPRTLLAELEKASRWSTPIVLYETNEAQASDDLITLLCFRCSGIPEIIAAIDELASSEWLDLPVRANDLSRFGRWSARLISDASLQLAVCT
ncbi:winged helix-turn-helix domain-containing protein [Roseomonas sp. BN140053]|uniref:winged helix-turn-helix domain-containing protein n=1 Tax=Roseomonas sp. BN140053 TaxID=3391898 RepID=UPI0039E97CCF